MSATFRDSRRGTDPSAGGRSVTASNAHGPGYLRDPESWRLTRGAREEHGRRSPVPSGGSPGEGARTAGWPQGTPGSAVHLKPGNAVSAARPWPSVETPAVCTDRGNCANRPS
jgi:hypothetical protein